MMPFWYTKNEQWGEKVNSNDNEPMQITRDPQNSGDFPLFNFIREIQKSLNGKNTNTRTNEGLV